MPAISPSLELVQEVEGGGLNQPSVGITRRFGGGKTTEATTVESPGANTLHSPATGKQMTLYWIALSSSQENAGEVLATVKLGSKSVYEWYLGNPGAFMHWEPIIGAANDKLVLELSGAQKVAASWTYTEG